MFYVCFCTSNQQYFKDIYQSLVTVNTLLISIVPYYTIIVIQFFLRRYQTLDVHKEMLSFSLQLGLLHRLCLLSLSSGSKECIFSLSSSVVSINQTNERKENEFRFNSTTEGMKKRTITTQKVIQYLYGNADLTDRIGTTITCILITRMIVLISTTIMDEE
jgi:hypothetical protein